MASFKLKLKNVLYSTQFCGICLENVDIMNMSLIDETLKVIVNQQIRAKTLKCMLDVVFKNAENVLASPQICKSCTENVIQSYVFIEHSRETSTMLNNYIDDLFTKSDDIFNHLTDTSEENSNVVIILENDFHPVDDINEFKEVHNVETKHVIETTKVITPDLKKYLFKSASCESILPTKLHTAKCKNKLFNGTICSKTPSLAVNLRICNSTQAEDPQCEMCLKTCKIEELRFHNCKFGCPDCSKFPCLHHKYLMSYREQILNHAVKVKCLDCDYVCSNKDNLLGHVNQEHLDHHPYTCDKCGQHFYLKSILSAHIHKVHKNYFVCQFCDSKFSNLFNYESHVKSCEDIKRRFACEDCPASFDSSNSLSKHNKLRHSQDVYPCGLCSKKFLKGSKRKEHMVKVHSGIQRKGSLVKECVVCQEKFDTKVELAQHMNSHDSDTKYPCKICHTEYATLRQLRAHCRKHKGPFAACHICGKQMREILLKKHLTTHIDAVETCETCGRSFPSITLLKYHQKVHLENVPCPKCKKMVNPARMRRHFKGHLIEENPALKGYKTQQPRLKCDQCDYKTWNNTVLECHINRHHLKIKPYVCHICSKNFIGKHLLKRHLESHELKGVICMVCLKSFANSACLKMHLRIHTGEKPFTCEICGDRFRSSSIMNVHKIKKHSDKRSTCPLCSNKFHTVRDLRRHVIKVHWKQKNKRFDPRELEGLAKEDYNLFHDGRRVKVSEADIDFYMPC